MSIRISRQVPFRVIGVAQQDGNVAAGVHVVDQVLVEKSVGNDFAVVDE
jgi:hypothetical protein